MSLNRRNFWQTTLLLAAVLACACQAGCVRRRLMIRSNPPGALVYVDNVPVGETPVATEFTYYGTRTVQLVKDGFETITVKQPVKPPWYELPGVEFISENLWPRELRDERVLDFQLEPQRITPMGKLKERAENLRRSARQGFVAPLVYPPTGGHPPTGAASGPSSGLPPMGPGGPASPQLPYGGF